MSEKEAGCPDLIFEKCINSLSVLANLFNVYHCTIQLRTVFDEDSWILSLVKDGGAG